MTPQAIALLQTKLGAEAVGKADGIMGPRTRAAFGGDHADKAKFALQVGCSLDRNGDPNYWDHLNRCGLKAIAHAADGVPGKFIPRGIIIHHTGANSTRREIPPERMIEGRSNLPGPLVQFGVSRNGRIDVYTNGRGHHAGPGSARVLNAVLKDAELPSRPGSDGPSGNTHFLGIEVDHSGTDDELLGHHWTAAARLAANLCDLWDWPTSRVIGHSEWTRRKTDPIYGMRTFRELVETVRDGWAEDAPMLEPNALTPPPVPADLTIPERDDLDGSTIEHLGIRYKLVRL